MTRRWQLSRAGITNVYQYVDETLDFAGGRLLLRGVNGSGKSTAMNMLLPFLLEADTRRIDAAGEQSAVLRSWMLSGRDEAQPVGYLWIEFARPDAALDPDSDSDPDSDPDSGGDPGSDSGRGPAGWRHLVVGCGIKANRNTERVTTWWFVTERRPGMDLALHERRVPLSVDALRAELGTHAVFAHDQRAAYRQAVRGALFGGHDLDQHLRLLHVVRSPRVGDRIDTDLPEYLVASLPELSESALDDAAQPLEDLEEHRRNVEALGRTVVTLDALADVYRDHIAADLRARAERLRESSDAVHVAEREERRCRAEAESAHEALAAATDRIAALATDEHRLRAEIDALEDSEAYRQGLELDGLRSHVSHLTGAVSRAESAHRHAAEQLDRATGSVRSAAVHVDELAATVTARFADLDRLAAAARLSERAPALPVVAIRHGADGPDDPAGAVGHDVAAPGIDRDAHTAALGRMSAATRHRRADVDEVRAALDHADRLAGELRAAERERDRADHEVSAADERLTVRRDELRDGLAAWRDDLRAWAATLAQVDPERCAGIDPTLADAPDLLDRRHELFGAWTVGVEQVADRHRGEISRMEARLDGEQADVANLSAQADELARRTHPEPPMAPWQRADRSVSLVDLVDFAPHLPDDQRPGLEAAMEGAGLLGAELGTDGALQLVDGQLVAVAHEQVDQPLSAALVVTVPDHLVGAVDPGTVGKLLDSISTRVDGLADTAVSTDGRFRVGALRGRHTKTVAEHIGVTARRAAIERQRAEVAARLRLANEAVERTRAAIDAERTALERVVAVRRVLPSPEAVGDALRRVDDAAEVLDAARARLAELVAAVRTADDAHAAAIDEAARTAATLHLPDHAVGLAEVEGQLTELAAALGVAEVEIGSLVRAHHEWRARVDDRRSAALHHERTGADHQRAADELAPVAARLATLEDTVGADYREVIDALEACRADLDRAIGELGDAREAEKAALRADEHARGAVGRAADHRAETEQRCVAGLAPVRRALAVDGVLRAVGVDELSAPAATPAGVRELADAVLASVAPPAREVTAEGVRISLRQRRDQLGAGWDAEDHQHDPALPLIVRVTGPLGVMPLPEAHGTARTQLDRQAGLLTAKQDQALRNLLQGLVAREVAEKMHAAGELVTLMNQRLEQVTTAHGIGVRLTWRRRRDLDDPDLDRMVELLAAPPDLRDADADTELTGLLSARIADARRTDPERRYRDLVAEVLDYRSWYDLAVHVRRSGRPDERLTRRTPLSEGEKKIVSYLPLFAAVAASYDALAEAEPGVPRFVLLDDAFAKVSEDNHAQLFGLLVELDLDFIATSERLWGTHATVPELAITEVLREADLGVIVLEHSRWDGRIRTEAAP